MKKIKVSVLIANYNGERYLDKSIESCLKQKLKKNFEIIVIDDNSTDNSLQKIKKFKGRIKVLNTNKSKNKSKFNTFYQLNTYYQGFKKAKGEIICFLDSDDYFKKDKLFEIERHFTKNKKLNFIFDKPIFVNLSGKIKLMENSYYFRKNKWPKFPPQSCISIKKRIIKLNEKKLFKKKFPLTTLDFRIAALAFLNKEKTLFLNKKLTYYLDHNENESNKNFKKFHSNWFKRRLEGYEYFKKVNKKRFYTIDYFMTLIINFILRT